MLVAYGGNNPGPLDVATACNAKVGAGRMDFESETFIAHTLRAEGHDASEDGTGRGVPLVPVTVTSSGRGWWDESDRAATLRAQDSPTKADTLAVHAFDARLPDAGVPVAYQCHGSNVGEMGTLRAGNGGVTGGGPFIATAPHERRGVRRLMPHELERLQGFPDHYTLLPNQQRKAVEDDYAAWYAERFPGMTREQIERLSKDGPRAKALGNSMAVPVMRWIGERVLLVDAMRRGG